MSMTFDSFFLNLEFLILSGLPTVFSFSFAIPSFPTNILPFFEGIHNKCRNQYFSTNVEFIKWKSLCTKVITETTHQWACAYQVESMNGLFLEQDCSGLNQVTWQCLLTDSKTYDAFVVVKR